MRSADIPGALDRMLPGAHYRGKGVCEFTVWAPRHEQVSVICLTPEERHLPMQPVEHGYWSVTAEGVFPGTRYLYRLSGQKDRPDPASRSQPEGVHGPSEVQDLQSFTWTDPAWKGIPLREFVIYEVHVGTFTREGTFEAVIGSLDRLKDLGITALELMPVAQFPGSRNWGYDGVYPYAPQNTYGGAQGLQKLINACHEKALAVILDVVYNHLGPDGNYLNDFGYYFTDRYRTPWGEAVNYDGACSDSVRWYFIQNALYWITEYHFDGLRLDAIDTIYDMSARHVLAELADAVHARARQLDRHAWVIAESDLNDVKVIEPPAFGGYGIDAQWSDDFHHALHVVMTGERKGYYQDFGTLEHLKKAYEDAFVNAGTYSRYRKRRHGNSARGISPGKFVICSQNHDQIGNRMLGERLSTLVSFEQLKLTACAVVLAPFIPLLFMGEEYGEEAPFLYFVSHLDDRLIASVREGRNNEFSHFAWDGVVPDPQEESTFQRSKIDQSLCSQDKHALLFSFYKRLIELRKEHVILNRPERYPVLAEIVNEERLLIVRRGYENDQLVLIQNFMDRPIDAACVLNESAWIRLLDSSSMQWGGPGELSPARLVPVQGTASVTLNPYSAVLYGTIREN